MSKFGAHVVLGSRNGYGPFAEANPAVCLLVDQDPAVLEIGFGEIAMKLFRSLIIGTCRFLGRIEIAKKSRSVTRLDFRSPPPPSGVPKSSFIAALVDGCFAAIVKVLGIRCQSEIPPGVVQAITVSMINSHTGRRIKNFPVHEDSAIPARATSVPMLAVPMSIPSVAANTGEVAIAHLSNLALSQRYFFHLPTLSLLPVLIARWCTRARALPTPFGRGLPIGVTLAAASPDDVTAGSGPRYGRPAHQFPVHGGALQVGGPYAQGVKAVDTEEGDYLHSRPLDFIRLLFRYAGHHDRHSVMYSSAASRACCSEANGPKSSDSLYRPRYVPLTQEYQPLPSFQVEMSWSTPSEVVNTLLFIIFSFVSIEMSYLVLY